MDQLREKITDILSKALDIEHSKITPTANFIDDLGSDSLGIAEAIAALENEFNIEISDNDAEHLNTLDKVVDFVSKAEQKQKSA